MPQINVTINGRQFRMSCEAGEEAHLTELAADLDTRIARLRARFGEIGDTRLTVMAALTVAVIIVLSSVNQALSPILNAALRFAESCIGTALAVLAVLMWPGPAERQE